MSTIIIFTNRDYYYQDIQGVFSCDYEVSDDDFYTFAEIQEDKRKEVFQSFVKVACERVGIPYGENSVNLLSGSPEYIAYKEWEDSQGTIFEMFKKIHNLKPVNYIEVRL